MDKIFRDPVHNIIAFDRERDKLFLELIDSREMQRLRRIRQLGFSYITYPGAEHSRFAHSIGCAHLMSRMVNRLEQLAAESEYAKLLDGIHRYRELLICAAILHDIGHGPFSHVIERMLGKKHEYWTRKIIIDKSTTVNGILKKYDNDYPKNVSDIIAKVFVPRFVVKLLSSQMDVDRIDYLMRDSLLTGADYGNFDLEWFLNCITVGKVHGDIEIGINYNKGLMIAEEFILARRYMYHQVYYHKTTRSAEMIVRKIFQRAFDLVSKGYTLSDYGPVAAMLEKKELTVEQYLGLDDHVMLYHFHKWKDHEDKILSDLCNRFLNRRLFKSVLLEEYPEGYVDIIFKLREECDKAGLPYQYYLEEDKAPYSSYEDYYITTRQTGEDQGEAEDNKEVSERIYLFKDVENSVELSDASDIVRSIRNKKAFVRRLYYPAEIQEIVLKAFNN